MYEKVNCHLPISGIFNIMEHYLQVDENRRKKKTFSNKLFGHSKKENQPPVSMVLNYKDLEERLSQERETSQKLQQEVIKLKSELYSATKTEPLKIQNVNISGENKQVLHQLTKSPASQTTDLNRQNSQQRMHHNIPHR